MDLKNSNYLFDPENWAELRNKGKNKFIYIPVAVIFLISGIFSYISIEQTRGDVIKSGLLTLGLCLIIFISRLTTWFWKEYKYRRYINKTTKYEKADYVIMFANLIRIIANLFVIFLSIKFMFNF